MGPEQRSIRLKPEKYPNIRCSATGIARVQLPFREFYSGGRESVVDHCFSSDRRGSIESGLFFGHGRLYVMSNVNGRIFYRIPIVSVSDCAKRG